MSTDPASHAELIAYHEKGLALGEWDTDPAAQVTHELRLAELRAVDPYADRVAELLRQLASKNSAESAAARTELDALLKDAVDKIERFWTEKRPSTDPELVAMTRRWRSITTPRDDRDLPPTEAALDWMHRERATLSLSEHSGTQDEQDIEEIIAAAANGAPLPDERVSEVDPERVRLLHEAQAHAQRDDDLRAKADAENISRQGAEQALAYLEMEEADPTGSLTFALTEGERAAALLLRDDREERETLKRLQAEVRESRARLDEIGRNSQTLALAEGSGVYLARDADGGELLCIDDAIFDFDPRF